MVAEYKPYKVLDYSTEQSDAEYWQQMFSDEVRVGRKERWVAMFFGFGCGLLTMLVIAVAVS
jgi:uncharacterized membrane protein YhaH (DUF805 family)